jgi:pimeloyl-ACP methyl ester carboxylesterase
MKTKSVTFRSFDGTRLHGSIATPTSRAGGWILMVHGITADRHEWGFYDQLAQSLACAGIGSLAFDFRCHGRSKALPTEQMTLSGIIEDIEAAAKYLQANVDVRPGCISVIGRSFGGGVAAIWAARNRRLIRHLHLCSPVLCYENDIRKTAGDWTRKIGQGRPVQYVPGFQIGAGLISEIPAIDRQISLNGWSGQATIFHGTADSDVPFRESERRRGDAELIPLEGAEHNMGAPGDDDLVDPMTQKYHQQIIDAVLQKIR